MPVNPHTAPAPQGAVPRPLIAFGQVRHTRLRPKHHAFAYSNYFWMLPMRQLRRQSEAVVARNRGALLSFHDADHGEGGPDALAWLDAVLAQAGLNVPALQHGEVWLQTYPRVLGHVFKPVSFWWVHAEDQALAAVVAEVNNTFGERYAYVLHGPELKLGREISASKVFHVSPFCAVEGRYRFRFMRTGPWVQSEGHAQAAHPATTVGQPQPARPERVLACVDHDDALGPLLQTSQGGQLFDLTPARVRQAFWGWPMMTLGVVLRIHWQALRVWLKGARYHPKPAHPPALPPTLPTVSTHHATTSTP